MERSPAFITPEQVNISLPAMCGIRRLSSIVNSCDRGKLLTILEYVSYNPDRSNPNSEVRRYGIMAVEYKVDTVPKNAIHLVEDIEFAVSIDLPNSVGVVELHFENGVFSKRNPT